jgi:rubrerythrin
MVFLSHIHPKEKKSMRTEKLNELLYEALETEIGGVAVYETAIKCATHKQLKEEWQEYLAQTRNHEEILRRVFQTLSLDPNKQTPGRKVVHHQGESLVKAMEMARKNGQPEAAQVVASECIVLAETKDHLNWQLLKKAAEEAKGDTKSTILQAVEEVEDQEDEHLYHSMGWTRELWLEGLGIPAVLPPPEEEKDVRTAIGAARAAQSRR